MLTIYATFKPFVDETTTIQQRNAVQSWVRLIPRPEILIFGDGQGFEEICQEFGLIRQYVRQNEKGVPYLNDMMLRADKLATNDHLLLVSADIILLQHTMNVIPMMVESGMEMYCVVAVKMESTINTPLTFEDGWEEKALQTIKHSSLPTSGDFFLHKRGFLDAMPPMPEFVIGRGMCDSWLFHHAIERDILVDATDFVTFLHPTHEHHHITEGEESKNAALSPEVSGTQLRSAKWQLNDRGLKRLTNS